MTVQILCKPISPCRVQDDATGQSEEIPRSLPCKPGAAGIKYPGTVQQECSNRSANGACSNGDHIINMDRFFAQPCYPKIDGGGEQCNRLRPHVAPFYFFKQRRYSK